MPELTETRRKLKIAIGVLAGLNLASAALLFSPLIGSAQSRNLELQQLGTAIQTKTRQVEPLRGLDKKIPTARHQIEDFYNNRLTSEDSEISGSLAKLAGDSGVKIEGIKYAQSENRGSPSELELRADDVELRRVPLEADLSGDYVQLVRFINALERSHLFFIVDSVELGGQQGGAVKLQMKLETYRKIGLA